MPWPPGPTASPTITNSNRQPEDQWTWLQREFALTDAQLGAHPDAPGAYQPVCAGHCSRIVAARSRLAALAQAGRQNTPEYLATLDQWEAIKRECNAPPSTPRGRGRRDGPSRAAAIWT